MEAIGIVAGGGSLPVIIASEAVSRGYRVIGVGFTGFSLPELEKAAHEVFWLKLGQLDKCINSLKARAVDRVIMVGKIEKANMLKPWNVRPDRRCLKLVRRLADWRDDTILAAIAEEFNSAGITVEEITHWAKKLMAPLGVLTKRAPTDKQWLDIEFGREMALGIGALDIGQTVVVKNSAVVAVEAIEGTDKAIIRAGELGFGGTVVVKTAKPEQDMRFDVPGIGPKTIESMERARAKVLAVEAGKTMITEYDETISRADRSKMVIVGIPPVGPVRNP